MKENNEDAPNNKSANVLLAIAVVLVLGLFYFVVMRNGPGDEKSSTGQSVAQIVTLSPEQFTGKSREAYQAAKDVPEVLAAVPCYCGCMNYNGHKHNLDCFVDDHGDT